MNEVIKTNALMLLNLYGVKEQVIKDNPEALEAFIGIINEKLQSQKEQLNHDHEILVNTIYNTPMGVSKWKEHGIKYGYDKYLREEMEKQFEKDIDSLFNKHQLDLKYREEDVREEIKKEVEKLRNVKKHSEYLIALEEVIKLLE